MPESTAVASAAESIMHPAYKCPLVALKCPIVAQSSNWRKPIALTDDIKHILAAKPQSNHEMVNHDPSKHHCNSGGTSSANHICVLTASACVSIPNRGPQVVGLCCQMHNNHNCGSGALSHPQSSVDSPRGLPHTPPSPPKQNLEPTMPKCGHSTTSPRKSGHQSPNGSPKCCGISKDLAVSSDGEDGSAAAVPGKLASLVGKLNFVQPPSAPASPPRKACDSSVDFADSFECGDNSYCGDSSEDEREPVAVPGKLTCIVGKFHSASPQNGCGNSEDSSEYEDDSADEEEPAAVSGKLTCIVGKFHSASPQKDRGDSEDSSEYEDDSEDDSEDEQELPAAIASGMLTCFVKPQKTASPPAKKCGNALIALIIGGADSSEEEAEEEEEDDSDWFEWENEDDGSGPDICFETQADNVPQPPLKKEEKIGWVRDITDGGGGVRKPIAEINRKWQQLHTPVDNSASAKRKKVSFPGEDNLHVVHYIDIEDRKGEWEMHGRDFARFARTCRTLESIIGPVLSAEHRDKVYRDRVLVWQRQQEEESQRD